MTFKKDLKEEVVRLKNLIPVAGLRPKDWLKLEAYEKLLEKHGEKK